MLPEKDPAKCNHELQECKKNKSYFSHVQEYLREYTSATGIHGLHYLTEKRSNTEKYFWLLVLGLLLYSCSAMFIKVLIKYKDSPVVVGFANKDSPIFELPFPSVTICPESKCSGTEFNFTNMYYTMSEHGLLNDTEIRKFTYMSMLCSKRDNNPIFQVTDDNFKTTGSDFFDVVDELKPELRMFCWFLGEIVNCTEYFRPIIVDEGICYSFNILDRNDIFREQVAQYKDFYTIDRANSYDEDNGYSDSAGVKTYPRRALVSGADNALTIYLQHKVVDTDYVCNQYMEGYRVLIHNPMDVPRVSKSYFRVPFEKAVVAAIKPNLLSTSETIKNFRPSVRNCYLQNERHLKYFKLYTQSNCLLECLTNYTLNTCGCVNFFMPRENTTKICGLGNAKCLFQAENQLNTNDLDSKIAGTSNQRCDCKPSCSQLTFSSELSLSDVSWKEFFNAQDDFVVDFELNQTFFSILSIYFKDEQFIPMVRTELYGTSDLISNFGGLLGLFTGFSLVSCVEIIYFFSFRIFYNIKLYGKWFGLAATKY